MRKPKDDAVGVGVEHDEVWQARIEASRRGGLIGGPARAKRLSAERRTEIARKAALARWAKA